MSIFKRKPKPMPNPIFEMGVAPDKTGKPTLSDVGITAPPVSEPMTATEVRSRMMVAGATLSTTGAGTMWTTTSSTGPWSGTSVAAPPHPTMEQYNVYRLTGIPESGLYLRLESGQDYYIPLSDVGVPNPDIAFSNVGEELVGNLLNWAMEALKHE